ncbi:hypothetical protein, partial [Paenibacillus sp. Y412MC10]|uniref:hypothetical protein n=1 Tax=Geobacillus sp. (strain Y412MC10) TaxID=481743 RepID=UPI001C930D0F
EKMEGSHGDLALDGIVDLGREECKWERLCFVGRRVDGFKELKGMGRIGGDKGGEVTVGDGEGLGVFNKVVVRLGIGGWVE